MIFDQFFQIVGRGLVASVVMEPGEIVGRGKGNKKWNFSAPHGAGRIMSRKKAKESISLEEYEKEMNGIWTSCIGKGTIDEAPMAYKDKELILSAIDETVYVDFVMRPIYNFKAGE